MFKAKALAKPVWFFTASLMCSALLAACGTQHDLSDMHDATMDMRTQTTEMNGRMKGMSDTTNGMAKTTDSMNKTTGDMSKTTDHMARTTDKMAKTTDHMSNTTDGMAKTTVDMKKITERMAQTTDGMATTTNHMSDTTDGMSKTMQEMKIKTDELSETSNRLDAKTAELYDALKQDNANKSRQEGLKLILSAKEMPHKISEATKYFWSFEFQVWSDQGQDTPEKRMALAAVGAREFLNDVSECMEPDQVDVNPLAVNQVLDKNYVQSLARMFLGGRAAWPGPLAKIFAPLSSSVTAEEFAAQGNRQLCFNALAGSMHEVNLKQLFLLKAHPELKKLTMLSLIEAAFRAKVEMAEKNKHLEDYPQFVTQVLMREKVAALLLQARYNFLGTMVLGLTTDIQKDIQTPAEMMYMGWPMDLSRSNEAQVLEVSTYLKQALELRSFMLKVGLQPKLDDGLLSILKNANLLQSPDQREFNQLFEDYRSGNESTAGGVRLLAPIIVTPEPAKAVVPSPVAAKPTPPPQNQSAVEKQSWTSWLKSKLSTAIDPRAMTP